MGSLPISSFNKNKAWWVSKREGDIRVRARQELCVSLLQGLSRGKSESADPCSIRSGTKYLMGISKSTRPKLFSAKEDLKMRKGPGRLNPRS